MNRSDLIHELANRYSDIDKKGNELAVRLIFNEMVNALIKGRRIEIRSFGVLLATRGALHVERVSAGDSKPAAVNFAEGSVIGDQPYKSSVHVVPIDP
jgi:nucleoid DNA-binding protein